MIIGITGTLGAGKGTVVEHLKAKGFKHYSVRDFLKAELLRRSLPYTRDNMVVVGNDLRTAHGSGYIAQELVRQALDDGSGAVIESIRSTGEASHIKENGGLIWAVDADPKVRYQRIVGRNSETDHISFEKFLADEALEMNNTDPNKQNLAGVMAMADAVFANDGTPEELYQQVDLALKKAGVELG